MALDTIRTEPERSSPGRSDDRTDETPTLSPRVIEVSDLRAEHVSRYARESDRREVYFERRGDRTYLVA